VDESYLIVHYGWTNDRNWKTVFTLGGRLTEPGKQSSLWVDAWPKIEKKEVSNFKNRLGHMLFHQGWTSHLIVHYGWTNDRNWKTDFNLGGRMTENRKKGSLYDHGSHLCPQISVLWRSVVRCRKILVGLRCVIHPPRSSISLYSCPSTEREKNGRK
jgi:hypothetical protein